MGVEIYWVSGSPYGWRVLLAALLKGVTYESHLLSMSKQEHKSPEYLAMSPRGRTPLLKDGDFVLSESVAIIVYLDSLGSKNPLFGSNPRRTAVIWEAIFEISGDFERAAVAFWEPILYVPPSAESVEAVKKSAEKLHRELGFLEARLAKNSYLAGAAISAADICAYPILAYVLRAAGKDFAKELDLGILPLEKRYPKLAEWAGRIEAIPGYETTYPPHWRPS